MAEDFGPSRADELVHVEFSRCYLNPKLWACYGILFAALFLALKIAERILGSETPVDGPGLFLERAIDGVRGRVTDISFAVFLASALLVWLVSRAAWMLIDLVPGPEVVWRARTAVGWWLGLTLAGWTLYLVSIASMPDPGTFLKQTPNWPVRVIQTIEGMLNLLAFAVTYFFMVLAFATTARLASLNEVEGSESSRMRDAAVRSLKAAASAPLAVYGFLGVINLVLGIGDMVAGFREGNRYWIAMSITLLLFSVYLALWLYIRKLFPAVTLRGRRASGHQR